MRFTTYSFLALCWTSYVLAEAAQEQAPSPTLEYPTAITPATELIREEEHNLELRQVLQVDPNAQAAPDQVPPVTIYTMPVANGGQAVETYTQLFSPVPDQWPSPQPGTIGYGTLQQKRAVEAIETGIAGRIRR